MKQWFAICRVDSEHVVAKQHNCECFSITAKRLGTFINATSRLRPRLIICSTHHDVPLSCHDYFIRFSMSLNAACPNFSGWGTNVLETQNRILPSLRDSETKPKPNHSPPLLDREPEGEGPGVSCLGSIAEDRKPLHEK